MLDVLSENMAEGLIMTVLKENNIGIFIPLVIVMTMKTMVKTIVMTIKTIVMTIKTMVETIKTIVMTIKTLV
jgi:hypothetical protein